MRLLALFAVLVAACSDPGVEPPPPPPPPVCDAGMVLDESGRCAFVLPRAECAPHKTARLGLADCEPIGAGPCAPPLTASSAWGCRATISSCTDRTRPELDGASCRAVGWSQCPVGFVEDGAGCRPTFAPRCLDTQRPVIGSIDCLSVGSCAGGTPLGDLIVDPIAVVDATHFRTIGAAVATATAGAVIAIAPGEYAESPVLTQSVTLRGTCAQRVRIRGGISVTGQGTFSISGMTLSGDRPGVRLQGGGRTMVEDVVIEASLGAGARVEGSTLELSRSIVRGSRTFADGSYGRGIDLVEGGTVTVRDSAIVGCHEAGVIAVGEGSIASLEDVLILDMIRAPNGSGGIGVAATAGGRIVGHRMLISGTADIGALAYLPNSAIKLDSTLIERTGLLGIGAGARAEAGGTLILSNTSIVEPVGAGVIVADAGSSAVVSETAIARIRPDGTTAFSGGLVAFFSAKITARKVVVTGAALGATTSDRGEITILESRIDGDGRSLGVVAEDGDIFVSRSTLVNHAGGGVSQVRGKLTVEDSIVIGSDADTGQPSAGLSAEGSELTVSGSAISGGIGFGILVSGTTAVARVTSTLVSGQRSSASVIGQGILLDGGDLDLDGVRVDAVEGLGILALGNLTMARTTVSNVTASRRQNGAAIAVGGHAVLRDVAVADNQLAGVVFGAGDIDVDGLRVSGTKPNAQGEFGHGLLGEGTNLVAKRIEVRTSAAAGMAMDASTAHFSSSLISANVVGAHAQGGSRLLEADDAMPLGIVFDRDVLLIENGTRFGVGTIPLPAPFEALPR